MEHERNSAALDEAPRETDLNAQHEVIVVSHDPSASSPGQPVTFAKHCAGFRWPEEEQPASAVDGRRQSSAKRKRLEELAAKSDAP